MWWLLILIGLSAFPPIYIFAQTKNDMALIPPGKLKVGKEHGTNEIFVDRFFMDRFEVTQGSYEKIFETNLSFFKNNQRPVEKVNWFEAMEYCRRIGKRLPNEWEWEWASRSGSTEKFYWGKEDPELHGWFKKNSQKKTHPVGQKTPNAYGLYDMAGNVWEWTDSYRNTTGGKVLRGGVLEKLNKCHAIF